MKTTTIEALRSEELIIFECVAGSRSYGLSHSGSDTDIRGVFILPEEQYLGLHYIEQVSDERHNIVFYELRRFVELLYRNNPNVLELLGVRKEFILYQHHLFNHITTDLFLSKLCKDTFARYAYSQIRKAAGLNKKILNPMQEEKKNILDFCYALQGYSSIPLREWLTTNGYEQERCGLVRISHFRDVYSVFYDRDATLHYRGIMLKDSSDDVVTSSVPEGAESLTILSFNKEGYSRYCKDYTSYQTWVRERNDTRYQNTLAHGKNYDAKNMMHVFRLLAMAEEIALYGTINTWRTDRETLLSIRNGIYSYDELVQQAEEIIIRIEQLFGASTLPDVPDEASVEKVLIMIRKHYYDEKTYNLHNR